VGEAREVRREASDTEGDTADTHEDVGGRREEERTRGHNTRHTHNNKQGGGVGETLSFSFRVLGRRW
jgi:hypothetical protein